jgi:hypothetical protein
MMPFPPEHGGQRDVEKPKCGKKAGRYEEGAFGLSSLTTYRLAYANQYVKRILIFSKPPILKDL